MFLSTWFVSCEPETPPYEQLTSSKEGAQVFIAKSLQGVHQLETFAIKDGEVVIADHDTIVFNVGYGDLQLPANDIAIVLSKNTKVMDSLNAIRAITGEKLFIPFPENAFNVSDLKVVIPAGGEYSNYVKFSYDSQILSTDNNYLIAFSITDASGYAISAPNRTIIFTASFDIPEKKPVPLDKSGWAVIDFSSEEGPGEGTNGFASLIIDGDPETYWHSCWTCGTVETPHYLTVDMKSEMEVEGLQFYQRQSGTRTIKGFELLISKDKQEWTSLGDFELGDNTTPQNIEFAEAKNFRYFKIVVNSVYDGSSFAALGEVSPYVVEYDI